MVMVFEYFYEVGREEVDFYVFGGWDKLVEWQLKVRDFLGFMFFEFRYFEA